MRSAVSIVIAAVCVVACQAPGPSRVEAPADSVAGSLEFTLAGPNDAAILVPVRLNGSGPYAFVLDTGATLTCLDEELADSLNLPSPTGAVGFGAGIGSTGSVRLVTIDSLQVGSARAFDLLGCVLDLEQFRALGLEAHGLLGLNVLKSFRVVLDFDRRVLILTPAGS